jgi:hypothetical protein
VQPAQHTPHSMSRRLCRALQALLAGPCAAARPQLGQQRRLPSALAPAADEQAAEQMVCTLAAQLRLPRSAQPQTRCWGAPLSHM